MIIKIFLIGLLFISLINCKNQRNGNLKFEVFELMEKRDAEGLGYPDDNETWFLVDNYKDNPENKMRIDSFVCTLIGQRNLISSGSDVDKKVYFFKKTRKTNSAYLRKFPNDFFRHSVINDVICEYNFNSSMEGRIKYFKDGNTDLIFTGLKCK